VKKKIATNCVLQGSKGEAVARIQGRGNRSRRGVQVGSQAEQFVRCVHPGVPEGVVEMHLQLQINSTGNDDKEANVC
jgi:hypothetical protein